MWKCNPSESKCDNSKVHDNNQNPNPTKDKTQWMDDLSKNAPSPHQINKLERDSKSISSFDSGIVTSPTNSHASQSPRESTAQSSLEHINSNPNIDLEIANNNHSGNDNKLEEDRNKITSEYQIDDDQGKRTCSEMALAIYQR